MAEIDIESKIREHIPLFEKNNNGWHPVVCHCDHGNKGPRGAFLFTSDSISFNCFNCGISAGVNLTNSRSLPKKFRKLLEDFGMHKKTLDEINFFLFSVNSNTSEAIKKKKEKTVSLEPKPITLPKDFCLLEGNEDTPFGKLAIEELNRRRIDHRKYPFMLCLNTKDISRAKWHGRLIIPFFRNDDLIFYQGQSLVNATPKYLNASHEDLKRSKILSNYDVIFEKSDDPIYVVEGLSLIHI